MLCPSCGSENIAGIDLCETCGSDLAGLDLPEAEAGFRGQMTTDRVGALESAEPLTATPEDSVGDAIRQMRDARHGCIQVQDGGKLVGIFTERDVLARVLRAGRDPETTRLGDVMTPDPITLSPSDPPAFAIHNTVARGLRHLPLVDGDELLGFLSVRHLLRYIDRDVIERGRQS